MGLEAATICEQPLRGAEAVGDKGSLARIARGSDIKEKFAKTTTYRCERRVASCNGCCWRYNGCSYPGAYYGWALQDIKSVH